MGTQTAKTVQRGNVEYLEEKKLINPVESLWSITLLFGRHSEFSSRTYLARFTSKLVGEESRCYLVIELREKMDEILREINVFGVMERNDLHKSIDYITKLKIQGVYTEVADLNQEMLTQADTEETNEFYNLIVDSFINDSDSYPAITSNEYVHGVHSGILLDSEQCVIKYGENVIGVTSEALYDILGLENNNVNNKRILEIARGLHKFGVLIKKSKQARLQEQIKPRFDEKEVKRFYLFRLPHRPQAVE